MPTDDDAGEILEDVNRIHPAVDRLRKLLESAALLDLKASADGYWTSQEQLSGGRRPPGDHLPGP